MKNPPFVCKGSTVSVLVLRLHTLALPELIEAAEKNFGKRDFFGGKACLLDVSEIPPAAQTAALTHVDWKALIACFADCGLKIAGILGATLELTREAEAAGLIAFAQETKHPRTKPEENPQDEKAPADAEIPESAIAANDTVAENTPELDLGPGLEPQPELELEPELPPAARKVLFLDRPLRSGQVVYARDSDLVVTAFVSPSAEIIADGNIYSFAPMRGRAHAGASGDVNARIFATRFAAEVVAIAHQPLVLVDGIPVALADRPVEVRREGDSIKMEALPS